MPENVIYCCTAGELGAKYAKQNGELLADNKELSSQVVDLRTELQRVTIDRNAAQAQLDQLKAQVTELEATLLDLLDKTNTSGLQWWFLPGELKPETLLQLNLVMLEANKEPPHA